MKAQVSGGGWFPSKVSGGDVFQMFFKLDDGKSARTYIDPANKNYPRWEPIIEKAKDAIYVDGLNMKSKGLVDADSPVVEVEQ